MSNPNQWTEVDNNTSYEIYKEYETKVLDFMEKIRIARKNKDMNYPSQDEMKDNNELTEAYKRYVEEEKSKYMKKHPNSKYRVEE